MKCKCQYSGIPFTLLSFSNLQQRSEVICVHPIFYADIPTLIRAYQVYEQGEMKSLEDQRLLFLALLNKTDQVDWSCTADPSPATVAQNLPSLYSHICWLNNLSTAKDINYRLPRFSINASTRKLTTFRFWLDAWSDAYNQFNKSYRATFELDRMASLEAKMREIGPLAADRPRANTAFLRVLADWCEIASGFPQAVADVWKDILRCESNIEAMNFLAADIDELEEWLLDNIEPGAGFQAAALQQVREVKSANAAEGINDFILISSPTSAMEDTSEWKMNIEDRGATELANIRNMIETAPVVAPQRCDYPDDISFRKAKAKFILAQMATGNIGVHVSNNPLRKKEI